MISIVERKHRLQGILKYAKTFAGELEQCWNVTAYYTTSFQHSQYWLLRVATFLGRYITFYNIKMSPLGMWKKRPPWQYLPTLHQFQRSKVLPGFLKPNPLIRSFSPHVNYQQGLTGTFFSMTTLFSADVGLSLEISSHWIVYWKLFFIVIKKVT